MAAVVQLEGLTDGTMTESTMIYLPSLQLPLLSALKSSPILTFMYIDIHSIRTGRLDTGAVPSTC